MRAANRGRLARTQDRTACRRLRPISPWAEALLRQLAMSARFAARRDGDPIAGLLMGPEGAIEPLGPPGRGPCSVLPAGGGTGSVCATADVQIRVKAKSPDKNASLYMEEFLSH